MVEPVPKSDNNSNLEPIDRKKARKERKKLKKAAYREAAEKLKGKEAVKNPKPDKFKKNDKQSTVRSCIFDIF